MKKRFFSIVFVFFITIIISGVGDSEKEVIKANVEYSDEYYEEQMKLQANAVCANDLLMEAFGYDKNGVPVYPDEFAGAYIEENKLIISLVNLNDNMIEKYSSYVGKYAEYVKFTEAEYSYNYLHDKSDELVEDIIASGAEVQQYYISQDDNQIVLGVTESEIGDVQEFVAQLKTDYPVTIEEVGEYNALLAVCLLPCDLQTVSAEMYDGYGYTILGNGSVEITSYTGMDTELSIPETINGYSVTSIGDFAFYDCSSLTSITIPESVMSIADDAFSGCNELQAISGKSSSYAEKYAKENGFKFVELNDAPDLGDINGDNR